MLQVLQAFDQAPIVEVGVDGDDSRDEKLDAATRDFRHRDGWATPHERIAVLRRPVGPIDRLRGRRHPVVDARVGAGRCCPPTCLKC